MNSIVQRKWAVYCSEPGSVVVTGHAKAIPGVWYEVLEEFVEIRVLMTCQKNVVKTYITVPVHTHAFTVSQPHAVTFAHGFFIVYAPRDREIYRRIFGPRAC